jgi:hypothetical protein
MGVCPAMLNSEFQAGGDEKRPIPRLFGKNEMNFPIAPHRGFS